MILIILASGRGSRLDGLTINKPKCLVKIKREKTIGLIKEGYNADILFWEIDSINEIPYWFNSDWILMIMKRGKIIN